MTDTRKLSVSEVAEHLSVGKSTIHKLIKAGELQAINISAGKKRPTFKILYEDLQTFIDSRKN